MPVEEIAQEARTDRTGTLRVELRAGDVAARDRRRERAAVRGFENGIVTVADAVAVHEVGLRAFLDARVHRIYGGTNEVMREIVARAVTGRK